MGYTLTTCSPGLVTRFINGAAAACSVSARGSPRHASRWLTRGEPARPLRSTPSARPDGEESLLLAPPTLATAAPSRNPLAQRLLAVLRPIRLTCGWGRTNFNALIVLQCSKTLIETFTTPLRRTVSCAATATHPHYNPSRHPVSRPPTPRCRRQSPPGRHMHTRRCGGTGRPPRRPSRSAHVRGPSACFFIYTRFTNAARGQTAKVH